MKKSRATLFGRLRCLRSLPLSPELMRLSTRFDRSGTYRNIIFGTKLFSVFAWHTDAFRGKAFSSSMATGDCLYRQHLGSLASTISHRRISDRLRCRFSFHSLRNPFPSFDDRAIRSKKTPTLLNCNRPFHRRMKGTIITVGSGGQ